MIRNRRRTAEYRFAKPAFAADGLRTVFLCAVFAGLLHMMAGLKGLIFPHWMFLVPGLVFLVCAMAAKRIRPWAVLIVAALAAWMLWRYMSGFDAEQVLKRTGNTIADELTGLFGWIGGASGWTHVNLTGIAPLISVVVALLVYLLGAVLPVPFVLFLLLAGFLVFEMMINVELPLADIGLSALGIAGLAGLTSAERTGTENGRRAAAVSALTVTAVLAAGALLAGVFVAGREERVYEAAETIQRKSRELADDWKEFTSGQRVNRGNLYDSDTPIVEVTLTHKPESSLYLRTFTGGVYDGGVWYGDDETQLWQTLYETYGSGPVPFFTDEAGLKTWMESPRNYRTGMGSYWERSIRIHRLFSWEERAFLPYGMTRMTEWDAGTDEKTGGYIAFSGMDPDARAWFTYDRGGDEASIIDAREAELAWGSLVAAQETGAPEDQLPRLAAWSRRQGVTFTMPDAPAAEELPDWSEKGRRYLVQTDGSGVYMVTDRTVPSSYYENARKEAEAQLKEITARVYRLLETHATYTKEPGTAPYGQEIIEYFLFSGHEGYCQQYASAEVLAYRMLGVPARYVSGYRVPAEWFGENGGTVTVTGEQEHAWAEVWLFGYGWVPVEMTLLRAELSGDIFPGYPAEEMIARLEELAQEERAVASSQVYDDEEYEDMIGGLNPDGVITPGNEGRGQKKLPEWVLPAAGGVLALALIVWYIVWRVRRRMQRTVHGWFLLTVRMLHAGGWLAGFTGSEPDIGQSLANILPFDGFPSEEFLWLADRAEKEYFGGKATTREENRRARKLFVRTQDEMYARAETSRTLRMRAFCMLFA